MPASGLASVIAPWGVWLAGGAEIGGMKALQFELIKWESSAKIKCLPITLNVVGEQ